MNTVLIVEDNFELASHWQRLLEAQEIRVIQETNAEAAIECLKADKDIALVITDMMLASSANSTGERDGLLVLAYVSLNLDPPPKVIAISGAATSPSFINTFKLLSPQNVLRKPVSDEEFLNKINEALADRHAEMERRGLADLLEAELRKAKFSVEHASDAVFWIRSDGSFSYANKQASKYLGYSSEEICQLSVSDINPTFPIEKWPEHWNRIRKKEVLVTDSKQRRKDGTWYECEIIEHYLEVEGGQFIAATVRDTTEAKKTQRNLLKLNSDLRDAVAVAEESERRFRNLADSASPLCWTTDLDSSCTWLNKRWLEYSGRELSDQVGNGWIETVHPDDRERTTSTYRDAFDHQKPFVLPYRLRRHDGVYRWHTVNAAPRFDENGIFVGFVGMSFDDHDVRESRETLIESEKALKQLSNALQATMRLLGTSDGVWEWKVGSDEATYTPGFRKLLGFAGDDVEGLPNSLLAIENRIHPEDKKRHLQAVTTSFKERSPYVCEFRVRRKDGRYIWVRSRANASFDSDGKATLLVGSMHDISAQKDLELERDRFFNTAAELFAVIDIDTMKWLKLSPTWETLLGHNAEMTINTSVTAVHPEDEHNAIVSHYDQLRSGEPVRGWVCRTLHQDGSIRFVEWNIDPPLPGESIVYGTGRDVTVIKEYMLKIEETSRALNSLNDQLARSNQDLSQFAYVASHDLQEPLRAVSGFLQLLSSRYREQLDERAIGYIDKSVEGAARMNQLINDLLHYSRVTNDQSERKQVDLRHCVEIACEKLVHVIGESGANIEVSDLPAIRGIEPLLVQLFQNLIGNAIKYRDNATPSVQISSREDESSVQIFVNDNGIGIATQYQQQVFSLFKRLHRREEYSGTGIGLAICHRVVERHGGSISVQGNDNGGSCFTITFPR